jgi:hypothetical protein
MPVTRDDGKRSSQALDNSSFNDTYGLYEHLMYGKDGANIRAFSLETPDTTITWTSGNPTQIVETYSDRTVTTDLTWVDGNPTVLDVTVT